MQRRLSQPMRTVLKNLIAGKPPESGLTLYGASGTGRSKLAKTPATTVLNALRKRGLVTLTSDANYKITPEGVTALEQAQRSTQ
jgi:hypothetical protein